MGNSSAPAHQIGKHTIVDEGDVILCYYRGTVRLDEIGRVHGLLDAALETYKYVYLVADFGSVPIPSAEVRRCVAKWGQTRQLRAVVSFGASPALRLIVNFLQNAIRLLKGSGTLTVFLPTEQAARAFVAQDRQQLR